MTVSHVVIANISLTAKNVTHIIKYRQIGSYIGAFDLHINIWNWPIFNIVVTFQVIYGLSIGIIIWTWPVRQVKLKSVHISIDNIS